MLVVPVFFMAVVEIALRLAGYGHPASFFLRTRIDGKEFFVPNDKFTARFFPASIGRPPPELRMAVEKPADTYRIFLFGESAALGDPEPSQGVGRQLEVLLNARYPGTHFEVVCTAMTAINSHTILPLARECARHHGDLWIIYMGNNEIIGPFGAGTAFGPRARAMPVIRASLLMKETRIGQFIERTAERFSRKASAPKSWGSMKMFTEHQVPLDDPARQRVYQNFEKNLEDILQAGSQNSVPIILSTVADNIKDCAPFGSMHKAGLGENQKSAWEKSFDDGKTLESTGKYTDALGAYSNATAIDAQFAELEFRIGRCELALTNFPEAQRHFQLARDLDTLEFRADSRINQAIKDAAARHSGKNVYLADAVEAASKASPDGIAGNELFYEHVHWNFAGNYLLARAFAEQAAALLPDSIRKRATAEWASMQVCEKRLAVTDWDRYRALEAIAHRMSEVPFTAQMDHLEKLKAVENELQQLQSRITPETTAAARKTYEDALAAAPDDHFLHENFAVFLEATGNLNGALKETEHVRELLPQLPMPWFYSGLLLVKLNRTSEAADCFSHAIALRPDFAKAHSNLGVVLANQGRLDQALAEFRAALQLDPNDKSAQKDME
ncbi:MAG TPA: tetratricopeptide repeat protein, partial [Verrucomicrobiae bacterium]|nr:tetratricopeptide repeat protein [Verrucomicrobiae bacterium]